MRKGKDIIGKPIIAYDTGEKIANIIDLIFDQNDNTLLGFLTQESSLFNDAKVLPLSLIKAIGADAVIIPGREAIAPSRNYDLIHKILDNNNVLNGTRIMTTDGRNLGRLVDLYFDENTGKIEGYDTSGGLFADAYSGRSFVPAPKTIKIGRDIAFVPLETIALMEEQVGGIKAAMQTASEKLQTTAQVASERIQSTAKVAGERLQDGSQVAGEKFQAVGRLANASLTNTIVDRSAQKEFAIGKVARQTIQTPDGRTVVRAGETISPSVATTAEQLNLLDELYRSAGGNLREPLRDRLDSVVARSTVEQALGKRSQRAVYTPSGFIIVAQGQIVTDRAIEQTKLAHQEAALLDAVGLSPLTAAQSQAGSLATTTGERLQANGERLQANTAIAGEKLQSGAANMWEKVKETANDLQGRSTEAIEQKRIRGALGRPTTRVILDRHDEVILNVGELIGHKAIEGARTAGMLDVLLDSVYTETPQLTLQELKAPEKGRLAL
ncbi:PRC-barrel domain-containing protein [Chamaesiphon sp. VAR_69_metabat_338]|uniref:PRC-barrel domain-containing protein n=1 Tax=Chamaesiphon sp. VAR_69_metabat_338 TaxID=2964704 RepID=UPI00286E8C9B|nr:PRC-barrel domain-containing protein [Chamaesiphon sp. VAR_69_metabat_338]